MGIADILSKKFKNKGISLKADRLHHFRLTKKVDNLGLAIYILENTANQEVLIISSILFDRFRQRIKSVAEQAETSSIHEKIFYKTEEYFLISCDISNEKLIKITTPKSTHLSSGELKLPLKIFEKLVNLLYHPNFKNTNEKLDKIVTYHKLFQFSFTDGSESITSDLSLKKGILFDIEPFAVPLKKDKEDIAFRQDSSLPKDQRDTPIKTKELPKSAVFKSRLGEKQKEKKYQVNYETLFSGQTFSAPKGAALKPGASKKSDSYFPLPILADEIKKFEQVPFRCEFSTEEINIVRNDYIGESQYDLFLGFEICDAIFKSRNGKGLKTFKFPLYYMKVKIEQSGRVLFLEPSEDSKVYLNHLAIASLIQAFAPGSNPNENMDQFFKALLDQNINVHGTLDRLRICRQLPYSSEVFDKTREILLGFPGENGKGGMFSHLKVLGIECDLESAMLYKVDAQASIVNTALEHDLDNLVSISKEEPERFNKSLLGRFFSPEVGHSKNQAFAESHYIPGWLPNSTRTLLDKLNKHNLVLLEGPPGTGKTFSILNLLIHSVCSEQRLLIVSDQDAAIHALMEKLNEYLKDNVEESEKAKNELVAKFAIKSLDIIPNESMTFENWNTKLQNALNIDKPFEVGSEYFDPELKDKIAKIDKTIAKNVERIESKLSRHLGPDAEYRKRVTPKRLHATTVEDIQGLVSFLKFIGSDLNGVNTKSKSFFHQYLVKSFIDDREYLNASKYKFLYDEFALPDRLNQDYLFRLINLEKTLKNLESQKPIFTRKFKDYLAQSPKHEISNYLLDHWEKAFPVTDKGIVKLFKKSFALFKHPLSKEFSRLRRLVAHHRRFCEYATNMDHQILDQLKEIHHFISKGKQGEIPLSLEIARFTTDFTFRELRERESKKKSNDYGDHLFSEHSIQYYLENIKSLQDQRDQLIKRLFIGNLYKIANDAYNSAANSSTSLATSISSLLDSLKDSENFNDCLPTLRDFHNIIIKAFPIWVCRKQAVSYLFPCLEESFNLVIVDEATQCRVDDALPLLFRAQKLLVVGDEKQTVLAKNSVLDDYLFMEFGLEEQLRDTQARGFKGGGSHIFGLIKGIKQASVLLDEHYRCPPPIISYSNKYVYGNELKMMQWEPLGSPSSLVIDNSEFSQTNSGLQRSGKFKGLETDMLDRFLNFVRESVLTLEKEIGRPINVEEEVAICYFLLKNEPYIKEKKGDLLLKLKRGEDILDGAGAALQGKERNFIFYLWDIRKTNLNAFRQGDDETKRKGELNVLMSRPKKKAFHFLHKDFQRLDHRTASITDFLWKAYNESLETKQASQHTPRETPPGVGFIPWRRYSGQLIEQILNTTFKSIASHASNTSPIKINKKSLQYSVTVGNPRHSVDLMINSKQPLQQPNIALVDICSFEDRYQELIDYFFQLQRAAPKIKPIFSFMHELADVRSETFKSLSERLESKKTPSSKAS